MTPSDEILSLLIIVTRLAALFPPAFFFLQSYGDHVGDNASVRSMRRVFLALCSSLFFATIASLLGRITGFLGIPDGGEVLVAFIGLAFMVLALESYAIGEYVNVLRHSRKVPTPEPIPPHENSILSQAPAPVPVQESQEV